MDFRDQIATAIVQNMDKEFVQRIVHNEDYGDIPWGDGQTATHQMSYGESDGRYYVYPKIINEGGMLKPLNDDQAFEYAMNNNEFIEFPTEEQASMFSTDYKKFWE